MVSRDTACRPSELLNARISQLNFKTVANGRQYASLVVSGKTGVREVVLTNSLPYLKDWLNQHPLKLIYFVVYRTGIRTKNCQRMPCVRPTDIISSYIFQPCYKRMRLKYQNMIRNTYAYC